MSVEGRELGWDDSIKQDSQNFDPIPEGDYNVTIEKYDRSRSKGEGKLPPCNMAVVYFIVHGQDREITIRENYRLFETAQDPYLPVLRQYNKRNSAMEVEEG